MTLLELLDECASLGVKLSTDCGNLRVRAPKGILTPGLRAALEEYKGVLLAHLAETRVVADAPASAVIAELTNGESWLSYSQHSLWLLHQAEPASLPAYNVRCARRFRGTLDVDRLEAAVRTVVHRHDPLRTAFLEREGVPVQVISEKLEFSVSRSDFSVFTQAEREALWRNRLDLEGRRVFDLHSPPLFTFHLVRLHADETVLLLNAHHLIADAWSAGLFLREIAAAYVERAGGLQPTGETKYRFAKHVLDQRRRLEGERMKPHLAYWQERLQGTPVLQLPADFPRPTEQRYEGASESFMLQPELGASLREFVRGEGATIFHALLASFAVLLQRLSGQNDFAIGTTLAGRDHLETEVLIGYFTNLVVLRIDLSGVSTFKTLLCHARERILEAFEHQEVPFDRIVQQLRLPRDRSRNPLFQVMFLYLQASRDVVEFPGIATEVLPVPSVTSKYDLSLHIEDYGEHFAGLVEFNTALFRPETVRRFIEVWQQLLVGLLAEPECPVARVPALGPAEEHRLLVELNDTATQPSTSENIASAFRRQALLTPDAAALVHENCTLTYADLDRASDRLAAQLRAAGLGPDRLVALCAERSIEMVVAMIATLKAGGAYLPLDPTYPAERLAFMLADARPVVVLVQPRLLHLLPSSDIPVVSLDERLLAHDAYFAEPVPIQPEQLAYVIYTSGSTGRPKGVMVTHRNVLNFFVGMDSQLGSQPGVWLALTSISFDISVLELFWTLSRGFKVVLHTEEEKARTDGAPRGDGALAESIPAEKRAEWNGNGRESFAAPKPHYSLAEQFALHAPTHLQATPSRVRMLLFDESSAAAFSGLERLVVGGESLPLDLALELVRRVRGEVHNLYGPTETTVWSTGERLKRSDNLVLIGRPLANTQVYVLNDYLQPVPVGVPGELYIGGVGVTRGYLRRPELTAERFVPDPFGSVAGGRLYRTGDLARMHADGRLECLGRVDQQIKILGHRIELGEIEATLMRHPAVAAAAVGAPEDKQGRRRLVAYLVENPGKSPTSAELRGFLRRTLPDHLMPSVFIHLPSLPLTPNGKVDRQALPYPEAAGEAQEETWVPPRTPEEEILAGLWADLLGRQRVGALENFFELGGHSLLAIQMIARVRLATGVELAPRSLFEAPTVAGLAVRLAEALRSGRVDREPPFSPAERRGLQPLSFAQGRLWFLEQLEPGRATYNLPVALRLRGRCDHAALERSLSELVDRHEILRTRFSAPGGEPMQEVLAPIRLDLPVLDLRERPASEREARAFMWAGIEAQQLFDLSQGPLFRALLARIADEDHLLVFVIHHIVCDDWSMGLLAREFSALYTAFSAGRPSPLPVPVAQYADFAAWQRDWLRGERLEKRLAYWKERLAGAVPAKIPADKPRPRVLSGAGREFRFVWSDELAAALRRLSQRQGVTLFMTLLAGFCAVLARSSRQTDLVVGTSVANRPRPEFEAMVGFFVNMLPLRVDLRGDPKFTELLERVKEACLADYAHRETPFEVIVDAVASERDLSRTPLFQVALVLLKEASSSMRCGALEMFSTSLEKRTSKFDLTLLGEESAAGISWVLEYSTDIYEEATMVRLSEHLRSVLAAAVADPDMHLAELPLLSASERELVVETWNRAVADFSPSVSLHKLFEEQAVRTPHRIAISGNGQDLSYAELDASANRLAHLLHKRGVTRGALVGLGMVCAPGLIVGILAILKAGGVYVPLDPAYPATRLALMAEDARLRWVVVDTTFPDAVLVSLANVDVVRLDTDSLVLAAEPATPLEVVSAPADLAYVIYTSGSTGQPKGVMVTHGNVARLMRATEEWYGFQESDVWTLFHSYAFDFSVWEIWGALLYGGRLVLVPAEVSRTPELFHQLLIDEQVTVLNQTPSAFRQLDAVDAAAGGRLALRYVIFGGEALELSMLTGWVERHGADHPQLINMYGITETTVHVTYRPITRADLDCKRGSVIGTRVPDLALYVVDEHLQPVPIGVPGELLVGGAGLSRGYLNRPDLTATRFVPNPFGSGRLYRSGDVARRLPDGDLEFLGRTDQQVKIRGFRIELGEIEGVLTARPDIQTAAVIVREERPGDRRLVAYVVPRHRESPPDVAELRRFCRDRLPDYMRPASFILLEGLPITRNGKLDRTALPAPQVEAAPSSRVAEPRDADEAALCALWADILNLPQVGVTDNFFELGGHSLLATQLLARIEDRFAVHLSLRALFEQPTVEGLCMAVRAARLAAKVPAPGPELRQTIRVKRCVTVDDNGEVTPVAAGDEREAGI
jgi:amino acid adenylation domain-containing protein